MGDTAVDFFLETLKQLITSSELSLIIQERHQLESLEEEIMYLRGFLKDTEKKRNDHPEVMQLVMQIRDLVSEAENIVELFEVHAFRTHNRVPPNDLYLLDPMSSIMKTLSELEKLKDQLDLKSVEKEMKTLTAEVKKIYDMNMYDINGVAVRQLIHSTTESGGEVIDIDPVHEIVESQRGAREVNEMEYQNTNAQIGSTFLELARGLGSSRSRERNTSKAVKEKVVVGSKAVKEKLVVGFEKDLEKLIGNLSDKGKGIPLEIISIIGAGGGGKTTLAREVYDHPFTSHTFDLRAWINISQHYDRTRKRDLLFRILEQIKQKKREDYEKSGEDKLGEDVLKCLKGRKYLIAMDDIWGIEAWNDIQRSFPKECNGSKVLFTSRLHIQSDSVEYVPHYLAPLPKNSCWELLQKKVFGMKGCPPELVDIGEQIAEKCEGLPLAVVTIAGILATEDKTLDVWEKVARHLSSIIAKNEEGCMEILELSYNHLPLHLKACFLYIGGHSEDKEIPVRELIWLWIAEGFIQRSEREESLETIAKVYLIELINRSLVQVAMEGPLGGIKACRVRNLLRELCLKKAKDDNFLVEVYKDESFSPSTANKHRRLFIGDKFFRRFSPKPRNLRSFLCVRSHNIFLSEVQTHLSFFEENFKLLRVLSFISVLCSGHLRLGHLVHLRYLSFASSDSLLTPFSYLLNLETLNIDLRFKGEFIELPRDIFKMVKLRHLYSKDGVFTFHHSSEETWEIDFDRSSKLNSLQTLHQVCACKVCQSFLKCTPNVRKLGLCRVIIREGVSWFPNQEFFECLTKLTISTIFGSASFVDSTLLPRLNLPLTITRITLKNTCLMWEQLSLLQTLPSLEVLRLIEHACLGQVWDTSELDIGFRQLKYLRLYLLGIEKWYAHEDQFPNLEVLVLERCSILEQIPIAFGDLCELREIKLVACRRSVEESARVIQEQQRNRKGDDDCLNLLSRFLIE